MQNFVFGLFLLFSSQVFSATEKVVPVPATGFQVSENAFGVPEVTVSHGKGQTFSTNHAYVRYRTTDGTTADYGVVVFLVEHDSLYVYSTDERNRVGDIGKDGALALNGPTSLGLARFDHIPTLFEQVWHRQKARSSYVFIVQKKQGAAKAAP